MKYTFLWHTFIWTNKQKKGKRKVQGVPQSQAAALPGHQKEEETDKTKQAKSNKFTKSIKISSLFPKRGTMYC